ncbi:hypothetical protein COB64_02555 [Candidatus Wolfebacteria bacterium]|nr:MAG: hypothetical protein COB64_02555 [Candidatus Wolfebacteria bacterium]
MKWIPEYFRSDKFRILLSYIGLMCESALVAVFIAFICYILWNLEILVSWKNQELAKQFMGNIGVIYALASVQALRANMTQYNNIIASILDKDKKAFVKARRQGLPMWYHLAMGTMSFLLFLVAVMTKYDTPLSGGVSIFLLTFLMYVLLRISMSLEDPTKGIWKTKKIPAEFLREEEKDKAQDKRDNKASAES